MDNSVWTKLTMPISWLMLCKLSIFWNRLFSISGGFFCICLSKNDKLKCKHLSTENIFVEKQKIVFLNTFRPFFKLPFSVNQIWAKNGVCFADLKFFISLLSRKYSLFFSYFFIFLFCLKNCKCLLVRAAIISHYIKRVYGIFR